MNDINDTRVKFQELKGKKILIYGTGVISKRLIKGLSDFCIVGLVDRMRFYGYVEGIPIRMWDEVYKGDAEVVIIAALPQNYYDIYKRIVDKCIAYDMKIYGANGRNLLPYYGFSSVSRDNVNFFRKNEEELLLKIKGYEAVSFDLFDTLIMRKSLEPADIFDIVAMKIERKGILIPDFKKLRREADIRAEGEDIYTIYNILQKMTHITDEEKKIVLEEEIECEKQCIIPRKKMVEIMESAHSQGKTVSIITNMYLPKTVLENILHEKGVIKYDHLYISCEYGVSKGGGLFKQYLQDIKAENYLHIGDDEREDVDAARKYGIDAYGIKSAYEMLKISNMRRILVEAHNSSEKGIVGLMAAELFNNPFALYETFGVIKIMQIDLVGKIFIAPIVILYMLKLLELTNNMKDCDGILFGSRDGYLFKRIYDKINTDNCMKGGRKIPSWYFMASRKLCLRASMKTADNIRALKGYINDMGAEKVLAQVLDVSCEIPYSEDGYRDVTDYYLEHEKEILKRSNVTRNNYCKYMDNNMIKREGKYIFCDLMSHGTVLYTLNQILKKPAYGFYLCKLSGKDSFEIAETACYRVKDDDMVDTIITANNIFMESILTSPESSVEDIDMEGNPVFSKECRTKQEIEDILRIQKGIENFFFEYVQDLYVDGEIIRKELPELIVEMHNHVCLEGECEHIGRRKYYDDFLEKNIHLFNDSHLSGRLHMSEDSF